MSPRSHSRSITPRRSYSRSPYRSKGRRQHKYSSRSSSNSQPPSPPPLGTKRNRSRYSSRSISRSISPVYKKRYSSRKHYSRSRSKTKSRSTSPSSTSYDKNIRNTRDNPKPSRCIGVFGLSVYTTQQKIREIFSKYGDIERIQVITDAQTRRSRGFCFIYYENLSDARTACDNCCGMEIDGRRIRVAYSVTQRPHTPTPGVYMGESVTNVRKRFREQKLKQRHHSPVTYRSHRSSRHRYERSRSRSYTPRRRY